MGANTKALEKILENLKENTPKEYIAVRTQIVYVKKRWKFHTEKLLGFNIVIPNTPKDSMELMAKIIIASQKYGKRLEV